MGDFTPLDAARRAAEKARQERFGEYCDAVGDVEEIYRHFAEQPWCQPQDAGLLTLATVLVVPEEEW